MIIKGNNLNDEKFLKFELLKIYGIGMKTSEKICKKLKVEKKKIKELNNYEIREINKIVNKLNIGDDLKKEVDLNIKNLIFIKCYRGIRHEKKLPVRGQRTRTNSRTSRK